MIRPGRCDAAIARGQRGERLVVELARALHLERHQRLELRRHAAAANSSALGDAEARQLVLRQVDAAAARVFADIADDVGELEGDAEIARVDARGRMSE